jgi:hypothetical protein
MSDRMSALGDATVQAGLLMESAQAHQKLAESQLEKLRMHTQELDRVVRDEIRRTLIQEISRLTDETTRATHALQGIRHGAVRRVAIWSLGLAAFCTLAPLGVARWVLPSPGEIAALRMQREELASTVVKLKAQGGAIDWRHCGEAKRLCVRIDRKAPTYGDKGDYFVIEGY